MEKALLNLAAFTSEAERFAHEDLRPKDMAVLITLSGELGAGKTTFTQAVARTLGVREPVTSPTFVLAKSYTLPKGTAFRKLVHIDAYRLTEGKDLAPLAFAEVMQEPGTLVLLEWPEMVADGLPPADVSIRLTANADGSRTITYA